jgi:hypothetical protein
MATNFSFHPALPSEVNVPATLDFAKKFAPQIKRILESAGAGLMNRDGEVTVSGQAVAAILMTAGLEMVRGLPHLTLYTLGQTVERVGVLDLGEYRHDFVRNRRDERSIGAEYPGFTVLDGSGRGMTEVQKIELAKKLKISPDEIRVINVCTFGPERKGQANFADPTNFMVESLLDTGLTVADWSSRRVLYLPAGSGLAATIQATTIHGLSESWPRTIRLASGADKVFHVAEVVDPQDMRKWGTKMVGKWTADKTASVLTELAATIANAIAEGNIITIGNFKLVVTSAEKID